MTARDPMGRVRLNPMESYEMRVSETNTIESDASAHAPRKMTVAENVVLTVKVLLGFGLMGAALWGISVWKSAA